MRYLFPDDRMAYLIGPANGQILSAFNQVLRVYLDSAGSTLATDLQTSEGLSLTSGQLVIDSNSQIPVFFGPDGFTKLYIGSAQGGLIAPVYADISQRLTELEAGGGLTTSALGKTFTQDIPSATWTITHTLPFRPNVAIVDSAGTEVIGDVAYLNDTTIRVSFGSAFGGYAYLS